MNFENSVKHVLLREGGYVDHPSDTGRETNFGITVAVARENGYTGSMIDIPISTAKEIYRKKYWDAIKADQLPEPIRFSMFDYAVNSGTGAAAKALQKILGVTADGIIGPQTIAAAQAVDGVRLAAKINGHRLRFMSDLATWNVFGKGWARRIAENLMEL